MDTSDEEIIKIKIKDWLKSSGKTYKDLADLCYVTETTIRNWMTKKKIPAAKLEIILHHMDTPVNPKATDNSSISNITALVNLLKEVQQQNKNIDFSKSVYELLGQLTLS